MITLDRLQAQMVVRSQTDAKKAVKWLKVQSSTTGREREAYGKGFEQGFMEAFKALKVQGRLNI